MGLARQLFSSLRPFVPGATSRRETEKRRFSTPVRLSAPGQIVDLRLGYLSPPDPAYTMNGTVRVVTTTHGARNTGRNY